ncbi:MAG TPA: hypothetical protein VJ103_01050 [Candidatus Paceibacterota bacterium]|nr:hypothetical protein [Candidatus Paceibacterota bacterium]
MDRVVIEVKKGPNDSNMSLLRKFQRRVGESGIIRTVKRKRFNERKDSALNRKAWALKRIDNRKRIAKLKKLGKIQ